MPGGHGVYRVDHLMTAENNLDGADAIISGARAFVGTYGGLAYLGAVLRRARHRLLCEESELVPAHLDVGWRLGRLVGTSAVAMDTRSVPVLSTLFERSAVESGGAEPVARQAAGSSVLAR